jgi:hypothetical protein
VLPPVELVPPAPLLVEPPEPVLALAPAEPPALLSGAPVLPPPPPLAEPFVPESELPQASATKRKDEARTPGVLESNRWLRALRCTVSPFLFKQANRVAGDA